MTYRQNLYKKYRCEGMNCYQAALKAGYSRTTALQAYRSVERRIPFADFLVSQGLDNDTVVKVLKDGLSASKVIMAETKDSDATTKDLINIPDHPTRHKFFETFLKLRGDLRDQVVQHSQTQVVIIREQKVINGNQSNCGELSGPLLSLPK